MRHLLRPLACSCSPFPIAQPARPRARWPLPGTESSGRMPAIVTEGATMAILEGDPQPECSHASAVSGRVSRCFRTGIRRPSTPRSSRAVAPWMASGSTARTPRPLATGSFATWPAGRAFRLGPRRDDSAAATARDLTITYVNAVDDPRTRVRRFSPYPRRRCNGLLGSEICRRLTQRGTRCARWSGRHRITIGSRSWRASRRAGAGGLRTGLARTPVVAARVPSSRRPHPRCPAGWRFHRERSTGKGNCISSTPLRRPACSSSFDLVFELPQDFRSSRQAGGREAAAGSGMIYTILQPTFSPRCG